MAGRRKGSRKRSKTEKLATMPTQRTIALTAGEASQTQGVIHVSRLLSQMNSRMYRQGRTYDVQFQMSQPIADEYQDFHFYTLPNTWFTHGAIRHAFKQWRATLQDELTHTGGKTSKWLDFSIRPDADGAPQSNIFYPNFWDGNSWAAVSTGYEQDFTSVTDSDGDEMQFKVGGTEDKTGAGNYNILLEFARHLMSRRPDDSSESGPQSYEGLQVGLDQLDDILEVGDIPPYDEDFGMWHGGADADADTRLVLQDSLYTSKTVGNSGDTPVTGSRLVTRQFTAPLGLVFIESSIAFTQASDSEIVSSISPPSALPKRLLILSCLIIARYASLAA